jgi:putative salt-induced outer membrane protein
VQRNFLRASWLTVKKNSSALPEIIAEEAFMKKLNKVLPAVLIVFGTVSLPAIAGNSLFTSMDDPASAKSPFDGSASAGYLAQSGNSTSTSWTGKSSMTWYQPVSAYSLWLNASNASSNNKRASETYNAGARSRYNFEGRSYLFGQGSWLSDRYNGYDARNMAALGYGRQLLSGPEHSLRAEVGPGVRYDDYHKGGHETKVITYAALNYQWNITDMTRLIQTADFISGFDNNATVNSETGMRFAINASLSADITYNITWNNNLPPSSSSHTDTRTAVLFSYTM